MQEQNSRILFLYTELAGYFLSCVEMLSEKYPDAEIHIFRYPVNAEAPFNFHFSDKITFYERRSFNRQQLAGKVKEINPSIIYCSGWIDKDYLFAIKGFSKKIPVIVGLDNKWTGSIKQRIACLAFRVLLKNSFTHCWIPGEPQINYALHLGFGNKDILTGFYSADYDLFNRLFNENRDLKKRSFPHKLIYSGRYVPYKWVSELCEVFLEIKQEVPSDWKLICLGTGPLKRIEGEDIQHLGFVQPADMKGIIAEAGVFVLPSTFEPWGVVVHEFAAAGFPMICSSEVGAATSFVRHGENGYVFTAGNREALKDALLKMISLSDEELFQMGKKSNDIASCITPAKWADQLMQLSR